MTISADTYGKRFFLIGGVFFIICALGLLLFAGEFLLPFCLSYGASYLFVGSNFWVTHRIGTLEQNAFLKYFVTALAVRFVLVICLFMVILGWLKWHQIFFTISFIISYICHSVIEIIFIRKILKVNTQK